MTKKRKYIAFAILAICILGVIVFRNSRRVATPLETPLRGSQIQKPSFHPVYLGSKPKITIQLDSETELPSTLPIYKINANPFTEEQMNALALTFGFKEKAYKASDEIFGNTYLYYSGYNRLRILPNQKIIDLKTDRKIDQEFKSTPANNAVDKIASDYLLRQGLIKDKSEISLDKVKSLTIGEGGHFIENKNPNLISVSYIKKINNYSILAPTAETGIIRVDLNSKLETYSVYIDDVPELTEDKSYPVKTFDEVTSSVELYSTIQSVNDGKADIADINQSDIKNVVVKSINIAYVQEIKPDAQYLQPVFILKGTASYGSGEPQAVTLYLPAISNLYFK